MELLTDTKTLRKVAEIESKQKKETFTQATAVVAEQLLLHCNYTLVSKKVTKLKTKHKSAQKQIIITICV